MQWKINQTGLSVSNQAFQSCDLQRSISRNLLCLFFIHSSLFYPFFFVSLEPVCTQPPSTPLLSSPLQLSAPPAPASYKLSTNQTQIHSGCAAAADTLAAAWHIASVHLLRDVSRRSSLCLIMILMGPEWYWCVCVYMWVWCAITAEAKPHDMTFTANNLTEYVLIFYCLCQRCCMTSITFTIIIIIITIATISPSPSL